MHAAASSGSLECVVYHERRRVVVPLLPTRRGFLFAATPGVEAQPPKGGAKTHLRPLPGELWASANRRSFLKKRRAQLHLELERRQIKRLGMKTGFFLDGDKLEVAVKNGRGYDLPAGPRPVAELLRGYFPDDRNGVATW